MFCYKRRQNKSNSFGKVVRVFNASEAVYQHLKFLVLSYTFAQTPSRTGYLQESCYYSQIQPRRQNGFQDYHCHLTVVYIQLHLFVYPQHRLECFIVNRKYPKKNSMQQLETRWMLSLTVWTVYEEWIKVNKMFFNHLIISFYMRQDVFIAWSRLPLQAWRYNLW